MEYSYRKDRDTQRLVSVDELEFRQLAADEGIELPKDDSTTGYLRALVVKSKIDERKNRERNQFRLKLAGGIFSLIGVITTAYMKFAPDQPEAATAEVVEKEASEVKKNLAVENKKRSMANGVQIEKLGGVVVELQEQQVDSVGYIVEVFQAKRGEDVELPPSLQRAKKAVEERKRKAKSGQLLQLTPEELSAIEAAAKEEANEEAFQRN